MRLPALRTALAVSGRLAGAVGLAAVTVLASTSPALAAPEGSAHETYSFSRSASSIRVYWRGNGHGHGMSQWGAYGAASAGLSAAQILGFYYPHTQLTTVANRRIRVDISAAAAWTTVWGGAPNLELVGSGRLPRGYAFFRLAPDGDGLALGGKPYTPSGHIGRWHRLQTGLPADAEFYSSQHFLRVLFQDGTSGRYRGRIGATRNGSGELTINNVGLDGYTKGVVSKEISPSWPHASVVAQAIAARTYGLFEKVFYPGPHYDICDTTWCQVYGGISHLDASGTVIWRADPSVVRGNWNQVLTYNGDPIFAQYSASNGGATVDGGYPYLVARSDPYDSGRWTPDPYLDESRLLSESGFAAAFGLHRVTSITVTQRDGNGPWGGRIVSATVSGIAAGGAVKSVSASGWKLGDSAGVGTDYLRFGS